MIENKKGMTWPVILSLIGLVLAALIILAFWSILRPDQEVNKQVCHESAVYKATVTSISKTVDILGLSLKCETENLCVTSNLLFAGNCDDYYLGEPYRTIRVSGSRIKIEEEINALIAEKFRECWWMMLEGKSRIYTRGLEMDKVFDNSNYNNCRACTRIAFAKDVKDKLGEINGYIDGSKKESFIQGTTAYMTKHTIPNSNSITYWQYITNSQSNYIYGYSKEADRITTLPKAILFSEAGTSAFRRWAITATVAGGSTVAGMYAGAAVGGVIGSIVPVAGTAMGALIGAGIGAIGGYFGGDEAGKAYDEYTKGSEVVQSIVMVNDDAKSLRAAGCTSFSE